MWEVSIAAHRPPRRFSRVEKNLVLNDRGFRVDYSRIEKKRNLTAILIVGTDENTPTNDGMKKIVERGSH